jgi:hypothetical protein
LTAYFAQGTVDASVNLTLAGNAIDLNGAAMKLSTTAGAVFTGVCSTSGGACSMAGAFSGPHAERAALAYGVTFTSTTQITTVSGAAAFSKLP